jgi:hypothetical protein
VDEQKIREESRFHSNVMLDNDDNDDDGDDDNNDNDLDGDDNDENDDDYLNRRMSGRFARNRVSTAM